MHVFSKVTFLAGLAMLSAAPSVFGQSGTCAPTQDPNICVSVAAELTSVTFSRPDAPSLATYLITVDNQSSAHLNRVR